MRSDFLWLQLRTNLTYGERVTANRSDSMGDGHTYARDSVRPARGRREGFGFPSE